jgi:hypothetical protein
LGAFVTLVAAFAFAATANATHKGAEHGGGNKPHAAFNAFVADAVPCADSVAIVPAGSIEVGLDVPQCYTYDMVIEDAELGSVHRDELTANWDLDGASEAAVDDASGIGGNPLAEDNLNSGFAGSTAIDEEDFSNDGSINGVCGDGTCDGAPDSECTDGLCDGFVTDGNCPDGECDGVDLTGGCTDGACDGLSVTATNLTCSVFASQPDSAVKTNSGNVPAKQPEIIIVTIDSVNDADNECSVQVSARTVLNPGGVRSDRGRRSRPS